MHSCSGLLCLLQPLFLFRHNWEYCHCAHAPHIIDDRPEGQVYQKRIRAEFVGKAQEDTSAMSAVVNGDIQLVYISPESLLCNYKFQNMLLTERYKKHLHALVVDEAHCIKLW